MDTPNETQQNDDLELVPPKPVAPVTDDAVEKQVERLNPEVKDKLAGNVQSLIEELISRGPHDTEFKETVARITTLGDQEIANSANISKKWLDKSMRTYMSGSKEGSELGRSLTDLNATIKQLDPSARGNLLSAPRRILRFIPGGNRLNNYFQEYKSAETHLNEIADNVRRGRDTLMKHNAMIEQDKGSRWDSMQKLQQFIYASKLLDQEISNRVSAIEATDPEKARIVREEVLYRVRQKTIALEKTLAVATQGYLSMSLIQRTNEEEIIAANYALTTTMAALNTAMAVCEALTGQKLVLNTITALNNTTDKVIKGTATMLNQQMDTVIKHSLDVGPGLDAIKQAFANIYQAHDKYANFRVAALENMAKTIEAIGEETGKARVYLDKIRQEQADSVVKTLKAPEPQDGVVHF